MTTEIQHAGRAKQVMSDPLAWYRALLNRIDFSERGGVAARRRHVQEVYEELTEARRRANIKMMGRD
jgi:hypothetical protein